QLRGGSEWLEVLTTRLNQFPQVEDSVKELLPASRELQEEILQQVAYLGIDLLGAHQSLADEKSQHAQSLREAS
ncbi:MAG: hypothetical protein ABGX05_18860, partial [Pirellulaceae bacterium]